MPVTRNGTSSTAPTTEENGEWRSTDGGEGSASRGVPDSASTRGTTTTPAPAFDMAAVLQATVQVAVREAINGVAQLQSQQTVAMPVIGAGETSRLVPLFDPTSSNSPTVDTWIWRVDDRAEVYRWTDIVTSCHALAKLHGPAKMWYDSLLSVNKTWPEWKVELKRAFPTTAGMQRLHQEIEGRIYKRALSTRTYDSPEVLLCCLKRVEERVGTVGSRDIKHSKASEFQNLAGHGNKENRAAETALNESQQNQQNLEPRRETEPSGPRRKTPLPKKEGCAVLTATSTVISLSTARVRSGGRADAANEKYFMLAKVNGNELRAYVDLGSQCVTIRRENADWSGIKYSLIGKSLNIGGYVSGRVTPYGEANVNLTVDQATADVPVLIVPNESQAISVIVGQPFTEQPHVTIVRRRNTVRIFEEEKNADEGDDTPQSINIPDLPWRPVCLWAKESTVVPSNYIGFVKLYVTGSEPNADVFVDAQLRCQEGREHCMPRCVVNVDAANEACIPVRNVSCQQLNIEANERVARAEVCYLDEEPIQDGKSSRSATQPCSPATANDKTGPSVTPEHHEKLDRLIEEYCDCFADNMGLSGIIPGSQMLH
ncbi:hypothetical protein HPB52_001610 [Rhipicephalus sanguineus]|uniref:Uncharacterized protein n=1 Tax=Rhipicephalus sanguineus TaxID=34632 RepID=A0A9D4PHK8_RHISA|nr:hypothetical protein HPB52_001610 [Rhipicephalus sanguineus]